MYQEESKNQFGHKFRCACGYQEPLEAEDLICSHQQYCGLYQSTSITFNLLGKNPIEKMDAPQLLILRSELKTQINIVNEELFNRGYETAYDGGYEPLKLKYQSSTNSQKIKQVLSHKLTCFYEKNQSANVQCPGCSKNIHLTQDYEQLWYLDQCCHLICKNCVSEKVNIEYVLKNGMVRCPEKECNMFIDQNDIIQVLGQDKYNELDMKLVLKSQNVVACFKCMGRFSFERGHESDVVKDAKGALLLGEQLQNYIENRFTCPFQGCKTEQCRNCNSVPYHVGFTCEENVKQKKARKCRFCEKCINLVDPKLPEAIQEVCQDQDCQQRAKDICLKRHICGHMCSGYKDEKNCLPCLEQGCLNPQDNIQSNGDDYCNICFTESLKSAPCIRSSCGHIFHLDCVQKRLKTRWNGPRIVFNFCHCPLCKKWLSFPSDNKFLFETMLKNNQMQVLLQSKVVSRLQIEGRDKDKEILDPTNPYYQKPLEYGMAIFAYYECHTCEKPYFGGLKSCQMNMEDDARQYDKSELICPGCCPVSFDSDCKKHGTDYIEFKCRFCCTPALWFCWGNTHFCDPCHRKATEMKNMKAKDLTQCKIAENCPLRVAHKPNGEECALGCGMCKQEKIIGESKAGKK